MAGSLMASDPGQWLAVNEERLLLHDGLTIMSDNIAVPSGVAEMRTDDSGLPVLDGKNPQELAKIIREECATKSTSYSSLMEYRLNALKGLWRALKEFEESHATSVAKEISSSSQAPSSHTVSFASRVSLVLIFPLIKSLSKLDPTLSSETASILLETLRACEPLTLCGEPPDCISGLENLLCSWLHSVQENTEEVSVNQIQNAASALVALAVAVGTGSLLLRTVYLLHSLKTPYPDLRLLVPGILYKLLQEHMTHEEGCGLTADTHILCWGYNDGLVQDGKEGSGARSIAFDGKYIFVTSASLKYLQKLGSGKKGTIKGLVYASEEIEPGWVVYANGMLLHRKLHADEGTFCTRIDRGTLKDCGEMALEGEPTDVLQTFHLLSDGKTVYWVYALQTQETVTHPVSGEKIKQHPVILQEIHVKNSTLTLGRKVLIQHSSSDGDKGDVVKVLVRASPSYSSSALSSLLGISKDDTSGISSCGLTIKMLQKCAAYTTGSSLVLLAAPPISGGRGNLFGVQGSQASKALCLNLCFSISTGKLVSHPDLLPSSQLHCALSKGASISTMAACYISSHHCIWTCNDNWIDVWDCARKVRIAPHELASRLGKHSTGDLIPSSTPLQSDISLCDAILLMLRHIGMESCRLVPEFSTTVVHNLPLAFLEQCCQLLEWSVEDKTWDNAQPIIITLQAVLASFLSNEGMNLPKVLTLRNWVRKLIWELLTVTPLDPTHPLLVEARRLVSQNCEALFLNHEGQTEFLTTLLEAETKGSRTLILLKEEILIEMANDLQYCSTLSPAVASVSLLVKADLQADSLQLIRNCFTCPPHELDALIASSPVFPPALLCGAALLNVTLRKCILSLHGKSDEPPPGASPAHSDTKLHVNESRAAVLEICQQLNVFEACEKTLEELCSLIPELPVDSSIAPTSPTLQFPSDASQIREELEDQSALPPAPPLSPRQLRIQAIEKAARSSVLGCVLQPLLAVISSPSTCTLQMANTLQRSLSRLAELSAKACCLLYGGCEEVLNMKVPAPWATGRTVETIHPVRDNYKYKETVSFPGANNLYLKFDMRCSSQYDYDKVQVYAGDTTSSTKVAEYGGNTHGFGSRSVLGKGWPKDLVKVSGDSVTFSFEMKSGREHSTPDKAMWGFSCVVRPQESADTSPTGLPILTDLYLSLASVCCSLIGQLYSGPAISREEEHCQHLLSNELLQCCVWSLDEGTPDTLPLQEENFPLPSPSQHTPLPLKVIEQLRSLAGKPRPTLRPSTKELLQPHLLEDLIVSVCLKQHGAESALHVLGQDAATAEMEGWRELLELVFHHINGLERRLQLLAELESSWWNDVDDIVSGSLADPSEGFFFNMLHQESTLKNLELLCCLKDVSLNHNDLLSTARQLQDQMEMDVERRRVASVGEEGGDNLTPVLVTRGLVKGVMDRAGLLLSVTIAHQHQRSGAQLELQGSVSHEDTTSPMTSYSRSISAPPISNELGIRRSRSWTLRGKQSLLDVPIAADKSNLLDQIFQFIGSKPEKAVVCSSFLKAARQQWRRGVCRVRALGYLHALLTNDYVQLFIKQLLASVGGVLQQGPGVRDVVCGGMAHKVRQAFAKVMHAVVELASKQPAACIDTISMLCIVPFTRLEEQCLVRSGLMKLLNQLCSLVDEQKSAELGGEEEESIHRVTALAWAAFQVLADRCVSWETQDSAVLSSGLAQQVSTLLTNHLSRAMDRLVVSESGASEGLQDALSLLLGLAKSHLGRAILSQPGCISKLLLLLTDQRPSPKLVLIALQLCRIALPLMTVIECSQVTLPPHPSFSHHAHKTSGRSLAADIVGLLLAKLAEYIVPDASQVSHKNMDEAMSPLEEQAYTPILHHDSMLECESGQASVYLYRRDGESAAEILQPLISQDPRHFRLSGHRMQEMMQIDRALTEQGRAEVVTDSYRACVRRALRWASMGFTVSVESPSEGSVGSEPSGNVVDKKRAYSESAAKKKNQELLKTDPPRPFLSGHVAYSLASEVIGLLHGLLTEPGAAKVWSTAIKEALLDALVSIPTLIPRLATYTMDVHACVATGTSPGQPDQLLQKACIANATFAALGGFKESIRPGMRIQVIGGATEDCFGIIQSLAERKGLATVQMEDDPMCFGVNRTLEVPLSRLIPPKKDTLLPLQQLGVGPELCQAICSVLSSTAPSLTHAHSSSDANTAPLGLCRLFAELRSRACMCLAHHIKDPFIAELFLSQPSEPDLPSFEELLKLEAKRANSGLRVSPVEAYCQSLRMLYRDCARPPPPRITRTYVKPKLVEVDIRRPWPPVFGCCFTHNLTSIIFQDPSQQPSSVSHEAAKPKGVVIYANSAIPSQAPSFYWELEVIHLGESSPDVAHVAMGYSPSPQEPEEDQPWAYPLDTVLIRSSGRLCQVTSKNLMEWKTFRLNTPIKSGDVVGCGWLKGEEGNKGVAYFTLNGERFENEFADVPGEMIPFVFIQKRSTKVQVNFGNRGFVYSEGLSHRQAADIMEQEESCEELAAMFAILPFANLEEEEEEEEEEGSTQPGDREREEGVVIELSQTGPPTRRLKAPIGTIGYDHEASQSYRTTKSFESMLESGPLIRPGGVVQEEEEEVEGTSSPPEEDLHALLVKAWEAKVFPVIQKRFRNDHERKSGLEQIKGALQLGMESIAQETVEFLYEENGGIPRDLHLPTMDDVKADLGKFTISHVKKGSVVVIQKDLPYSRCGGRTLQKTQGLTGIVLDVDQVNEVIQVETYLQNEGALVQFWYPVVYLERPPPGYRKSSSLRGGDAASMLVHRQLLRCEGSLVSMYSRRALLTLHKTLERNKEELMDHLKLVSEECFAEPLTEGPTTTTNPDLAPSPSTALQPLHLSPLPLFYSDPNRLQQDLLRVLTLQSAVLVGVAQRMCHCLLKTPEGFGSTDFKVSETKEVVDIANPDTAFVIVTCTDDRTATCKPISSMYKYPWARVMCYQGGQGKAGRQQVQEVARYPNTMTQTMNQQYCGPVYPSLILPCNRIHLKLGGCSTKPGKLLNVLTLPTEFPLALSFAHCLSQQVAAQALASHVAPAGEQACMSKSARQQVVSALSVCLQGLSKFLNRIDCPIPLKEVVFHLLTDIIWTLCCVADAEAVSIDQPLYTFPTVFVQRTQQELLKLYTSEVSKFSKVKPSDSFPPAESIGAGGLGRFSTYFQALLEFVVAVLDYQHKFHGLSTASSSTTLVPSNGGGASGSGSNPGINRSISGSGTSGSGSGTIVFSDTQDTPTVEASSSMPMPSTNSKSEVSLSATPTSGAAPIVASSTDPIAGKKLTKRNRSRKGVLKKESLESSPKEEWLSVVNQAITLLRVVATPPESCGHVPLPMPPSTTHLSSRLVVVTGLPHTLSRDAAELAIKKVCKRYGGLYRDALYLPGPADTSSDDQHAGHAVLELRCGVHTSAVCSALLAATSLQQEGIKMEALSVNNTLTCGGKEESANQVLVSFLRSRLNVGGDTSLAMSCMAEIFNASCAEGVVSLDRTTVTGPMLRFFATFSRLCAVSAENYMAGIWEEFGEANELLSLAGFSKCFEQDFMLNDEFAMRGVWLSLIECGYDLYLERTPTELSPAEVTTSTAFTSPQDVAVVEHVDSLCRHLAVTANSLQPWDIHISEAEKTSEHLSSLQGVSLLDIRLRFSQLKLINQQLSMLLPLIDLRSTHPFSLGQRLSSVTPILFYDVKISFFHSVLNASTRRSLDQAPPEIKMDPLESVGGVATDPLKTHFCQAAQQMLSVPSPHLCVALASGGDPTYAFNVKLSGEEVHGTSGSFRHFLWQVVRELQSSVLPLLLPCPSSAVGINHGKYILAPGAVSFPEEKLLQFFGQLLGVAIRADVPITIDFLPCFWKSLRGEALSLLDLKEADVVTYNLSCKILSAKSAQEFQEVVNSLKHIGSRAGEEKEFPTHNGCEKKLTFVYHTLNGVEEELVEGGREVIVEYSNRRDYVDALRRFRLEELACPLLMNAVRCGLSSVIPLQLLTVLTPQDLSLRGCGLPTIDLEYLKRHTMYQVGLMESDKHIQFFWSALESFSQDELRKFIKFSCNQERIPFGLPCREGDKDNETHVPPYPMKIAPPDGRGPPDDRYVRAETCMFMIKLPQYSSQQIMTERLRYAIHCREDPLSG